MSNFCRLRGAVIGRLVALCVLGGGRVWPCAAQRFVHLAKLCNRQAENEQPLL